jgi:hypothetical protein
MPRFRDAVADHCECDEHGTRKRRQRRIGAFDENGRRSGPQKNEIAYIGLILRMEVSMPRAAGDRHVCEKCGAELVYEKGCPCPPSMPHSEICCGEQMKKK